MAFQFLGDVLGGFNDTTDKIRQQNQVEADRQAQRDNSVFEALANSDDPEIRAAAVTGLLTNNHPARALDKFLGKVGTHPAYETIKGLIGQGHQAFPGETEQQLRKTTATEQGKISGAFTGLDKSGVALTPEQRTHVGMGMTGAAQRNAQPNLGNLVLQDGSEVAGYFDPDARTYYDQSGSPRYDVKEFRRATSTSGHAGSNPYPGSSWTSITGEAALRANPEWETQYGIKPGDQVRVHLQASGQLVPNAVPQVVPGPPEPVPTPFTSPQGTFFIKRGGQTTPAPPELQGGRASTPEVNVSALKGAIDEILRLVPAPTGILGSGQRVQADVAARRDKAAVGMGYASFAAMQQMYGDAVGNVGDAYEWGRWSSAAAGQCWWGGRGWRSGTAAAECAAAGSTSNRGASGGTGRSERSCWFVPVISYGTASGRSRRRFDGRSRSGRSSYAGRWRTTASTGVCGRASRRPAASPLLPGFRYEDSQQIQRVPRGPG
jgi:hypothetical protein